MKPLATIVLAVALGLTTLVISTIAAADSRKLSGREIREKLAGMELTDGVHWRDVYDRDGTLRSYSDGKGRIGKWVIRKDELCVYFKEPDDGCYEVSLAGDRIEMKPSGLGLSVDGILQKPTDRD